MDNCVELAVAGSGKTNNIAKHCASLSKDNKVAVVTFTQMAQTELRRRIAKHAGDHPFIEVMGWYSFLIRHFARPFFPFAFSDKRVLGFNFEGRPHQYAKGYCRFCDSYGAVYACELARLSYILIQNSRGSLLRRLECIYDEILIDEVQDFSGYDWDILADILKTSIRVRMVGDVRQAILSTNARAQKNKKYARVNAVDWFQEQEKLGLLRIEYKYITRRCRPEIAGFADTIYETSIPFPKTKSLNNHITGHDGVFLLRPEHVLAYVDRYDPKCLRYDVRGGGMLDLNCSNYGAVKGATYDRVLIIPTKPIEEFIKSGKCLKNKSAAGFYVAVTRAAQSVAIILDKPGNSLLPYWEPQ